MKSRWANNKKIFASSKVFAAQCYILLLLLGCNARERRVAGSTEIKDKYSDTVIYKKLVDQTNREIARFALKKPVLSQEDLNNFERSLESDSNESKNVAKALPSEKIKNVELANEVEKLKLQYPRSFLKDSVISFLTNDIFNDEVKYNKINTFRKNRLEVENGNIDKDFIPELKSDLTILYDDLKSKKDTIFLQPTTKTIANEEPPQNDYLWYIVIAIVFITILFLVIKFMSKKKNKARHSKHHTNSQDEDKNMFDEFGAEKKI